MNKNRIGCYKAETFGETRKRGSKGRQAVSSQKQFYFLIMRRTGGNPHVETDKEKVRN